MGVYQNIWISGFHRLVARSSNFPCVEIISWLLPRVDVQNRLLKRIDERSIAPFKPSTLEAYYKLLFPIVFYNREIDNNNRSKLSHAIKKVKGRWKIVKIKGHGIIPHKVFDIFLQNGGNIDC